MRQLSVRPETFPIRDPFRIARGEKREAIVVVAEISDDAGRTGAGECVPYARYGESVDGVVRTIESLGVDVAAGLDRVSLARALPAGAARNALDCALWDLEAQIAGVPVSKLAGLAPPAPVVTAYTISIDAPDAMERAARREMSRPLLKIKLAGDGHDVARLEAVRRGAPSARLIVDGNEAFDLGGFARLLPELAALGVELVEQPLPRDDDAGLADLAHDIPICADESVHDRATLARLAGRYDAINVKLDKTGGLTEAIALVDRAERAGLAVMVGCMVCSSLSIAPALLLAARARFVDLDGSLLLAADRPGGATFADGRLVPPSPTLWGAPRPLE